MNWKETADAYGRPFARFAREVLDVFPRNGHWLKLRDIVPKVDRRFDILFTLQYLESEGAITIDESCVSITRYKLGGTKIEPVGPETPNMTIRKGRTHRLPDRI